MATQNQKKVAKLIVDNITLDKPLNGGEMLEKVGYSKNLVKQPGRILESEGVKEELRTVYGFDPERAKEIVGTILENGENDTVKLKAADMIFKVHSTYAPEKRVNLNINETRDTKLDAIVERIENELDLEGTTESA